MLKEKLTEALKNKRDEKLNSYIWKGRKIKCDGEIKQDIVKLVDATPEQLKQFMEYCELMLNNNDKVNPGRYIVLKLINDQIMNCKAELFLRMLETSEQKMPRFTFYEKLKSQLEESNIDPKDVKLGDVSDNCPIDFEDIPVDLLFKACLSATGKFSKRHMSISFILKHGVWPTSKEKEELLKDSKDDILEVIRKELNLRGSTEFKLSPKGLSFTEIKNLINIKDSRYSDLTTEQLFLLRSKMLLMLKKEVETHISQWENRINQIKEVANFKGYDI